MRVFRRLVWVFCFQCWILLAAEVGVTMDKLEKLSSEGQWRELREASSAMLDGMDAGDVRAGVVWNKLAQGLEWGNDIARYDDCLEKYALGKFAGNVSFWGFADWSGRCSSGVMIANVFKRGANRGNAGRHVTCGERDRARILSGMAALIDEAERAAWGQMACTAVAGGDSAAGMSIRDLFYFRLLEMLLEGRDSGSSFKLQALTDLSALPDYDGDEGGVSSVSRPPVNADGSPVLYALPRTWGAAVNDGQRLRFAAERAMRSKNTQALERWADFLRGQFDVQTMRPDLLDEYQVTPAMREYLYALKEDETIAELATGTRKITLPPEFNYVAMYRKAGAYQKLGEIFASRMQFEAAVEAFEKAGMHDEVRQLTGSWGAVDRQQVALAGTDVTLRYHFRNARKAELRFYRVDAAKALAQMLESLGQSDGRRRNLWDFSWKLVQWQKDGIVGAVPERTLTQVLEPLPHHWETTAYLKLGKMSPGAFVVEIVPDGNTSSCVRQTLWIADYALSAHGGTAAGKARLFLNEPVSGRPVAGAKISICTVYGNGRRGAQAKNGRKDEACVTDGDGVAEIGMDVFKVPDGCYCQGRYVIAESSSGRLTLLDNPYVGIYRPWREPNARRTFMITDKTVYKPGDAIAFTGYLRRPRYDGLAEPYDGASVTLKLRNPQGKEVLAREVPFDSSSQSFTVELALPADALLGQWTAQLQGIPGSTVFRVEEYKKPEYLLKVVAPDKPVKAGEMVSVALEAAYYFGASLGGADVTYRVFREETGSVRPFAFVWNWLYGADYALCQVQVEQDGGRHANFGRVQVVEGQGRTDADGRLSFQIDSSKAVAIYGARNFRYAVEAEVRDTTGRVVSGSGSVVAAVKPFEVAIYTPWGFAETGRRQTIRVAAKTADGKDVGGTGVLRIFRRKLNAAGFPERSGEALKSIGFVPGGADELSFILNEEGVYELEAEVVSADGATATGTARIFVVGETRGEALFGEYPMSLSTDKPTYQPGEVARILITCDTPFRTVYFFARSERDAAMRRITLTGYSTIVEVPVRAGDQPNFFVSAMSCQNGKMLTLRKEIPVPPEKKVLKVSAEPASGKVRPGTTVPLKLTVTGLDGKPVSGNMTIAVYDKSLEAISNGAIPAICPFFWNWRRWDNLAFTWNSAQGLGQWREDPGLWTRIERRFSVPFHADEAGGGRYANDMMVCMGAAPEANGVMVRKSAAGKMMSPAPLAAEMAMAVDANADMAMAAADAGGAPAAEESCALRTNFQDRAFWAGRLAVPESGEVIVDVPIPDNMTTWVVRAWSLTPDTRVGEARTEIVVSKDLIARLELPRFMVQGDRVSAVVTVNNTTALEKRGVRLALSASGALGVDWSRTAHVPAHGAASFEVPLTASAVGEAVFRLTAVAGDESDGLELKMPVLVKGIDKQVNFCGRLDGRRRTASFTLEVPESRRKETTAFSLTLSPGVARGLVELLPYLAADDSSDVFSLVGRCVPALSAKAALERLGVSWEAVAPQKTARDSLYAEYLERYVWGGEAKASFTAAVFDKVIAKSLRDIQSMVNSDGGWGWLGGCGEESWPDTTATVVDALLELRSMKAGGIPPTLASRGVKWLAAHAARRVAEIRKDGHGVNNTDCLVARVLAKAGKPSGELMGQCYAGRVKHLSPYGLAMLALAYPAGTAEAAMLRRNLEQFLKVDDENGTAYLDIPTACCLFWYGNENETLAAYLELLLRDEPQGELAQKIANYLVTNVRNSPWRNSVRSLGAAVRALARHVAARGEDKPDFTVKMTVGGETQTVVFNAKNVWSSQNTALFLPAEKLPSGRHAVTLEFSGTGALYWNGMLRYFSLEECVEPSGLEMKIRRNYYRLVKDDGAGALLAGKGGAAVREGVLKYRRVPLKDGDAVSVGDLLEVELVSTAKNDYDYVQFQDAMPSGFEYEQPVSGWRWSWGAPMYVECRERGARIYLRNMARGESNAFYRIRAQLPGRVTALPATGGGVYAPELKCNGAQQTLETRK